jgi:hypothetical protein
MDGSLVLPGSPGGELIFFACSNKSNQKKEHPINRPSGLLRYSENNGRCGTHKKMILNHFYAQTVLAINTVVFLRCSSVSMGESNESAFSACL